MVNGKYVFYETSKYGSTINGRVYQNEKVVVAPGTAIYLANKVPLPWAQVLMLLPNAPIRVQNNHHNASYETVIEAPVVKEETIGAGWAILSFLIPLLGLILYLVWNDTSPYKAKQAAKMALIGFAINVVLILLSM